MAKPCRSFVTTMDQGLSGPRVCVECGCSEAAHYIRRTSPTTTMLIETVPVEHMAGALMVKLTRWCQLLAAIDLGAHLTDEQYNGINEALKEMGVTFDRGDINDIFEEAHLELQD